MPTLGINDSLNDVILSDPINWDHPLNGSLCSWWLAMPRTSNGVFFYDLAGKYNTTLTNAPSWVGSTRPGGSLHLSLNGTNQYTTATNPSLLNFDASTSSSVSCWVRYSTSMPNFTGLVCKATSTNPMTGWQLLLVSNKFAAELANSGTLVGSGSLIGTTTLSDGIWHHCVLTVDKPNTTAKLYVDGKQEVSVNNANIALDHTNTGNLLIGVERTPVFYLNGWMDDIRVWRGRVLSSSDVFEMFANAKANYPNLLNRWSNRIWSFPGWSTNTYVSSTLTLNTTSGAQAYGLTASNLTAI